MAPRTLLPHNHCPLILTVTWNQFSISSAPEDPYVSVTISPAGDWTKDVSAELGAGPAVVAALANATNLAEVQAYGGAKAKDAPAPPYSYADEAQEQGHNTSSSVDNVEDGFLNTIQNRSLLMSGGGIRPSDQFYEVVSGSQSRLSTASRPQADAVELPKVRIDGPYGAPSEDVFRSDLAILVGAGIGVTPFASILKHIWYRQRAGRLGRLRHVEFIWVCRDAKSFAWFGSVLREIEDAQVDRKFISLLWTLCSLVSDAHIVSFCSTSKFPADQHVYHREAFSRPTVQHRD